MKCQRCGSTYKVTENNFVVKCPRPDINCEECNTLLILGSENSTKGFELDILMRVHAD